MGGPIPRDFPLPTGETVTAEEAAQEYSITPLEMDFTDAPEFDVIPVGYYVRSNRAEMPLFRRVGEGNLQPYAFIEVASDLDEVIGAGLQSALGYSPDSKYKPIIYAGLRSLTMTNEYSKHPIAEIELSDPQYNRQSGPNDKATDLIKRLKVGTLLRVKFGYQSAHTVWKGMKVIEAELTFNEGAANLKIKAVAGYRIKDTTSSDVYTKSRGASAVATMANALGLSIDLSKTLTEEAERISNLDAVVASLGVSEAFRKNGIDYAIDPETGELRIETPFKYELIKKGDVPMRLTYGYPVSSVASLEYKKTNPKVGGSNTGGKLGNNQSASGGLNAGERTFTSYWRGAFGVSGMPERFGGLKFIISPPAKTDANLLYPISRGYTHEDNDFLTVAKPTVNVKKTVKVKSGTVVEGEPRLIRATELRSALLSNPTNKHYEFSPTGFRYSPPQGYEQEVIDGLGFEELVAVEVRVYEFTEAEAQTPAQVKDKPSSTKVTTDMGEGTESWEDDFNSLVRLPLGQEDASKVKDTNSVAYKAHQQIKAHEELALKEPDRYRIRRGRAGDGAQFVVLQMKVTDDPSQGNQSNKDSGGGDSVDDAVGGDGTAMADQKPKSSEERTTASAKARRAAPKTELTIKFKAGDWSMRVGRIIELVDVYETVNGFYYIHKEVHKVNIDGFHTEVVCREARPSEVKAYGNGKLKPLKGTGKPKSGEQADKDKAQNKPLEVISTEESQERQAVKERRARNESLKIFTDPTGVGAI